VLTASFDFVASAFASSSVQRKTAERRARKAVALVVLLLALESNLQPFRVERVIGNLPLIQFLTPFPGGRYQVREASYDPQSNRRNANSVNAARKPWRLR